MKITVRGCMKVVLIIGLVLAIGLATRSYSPVPHATMVVQQQQFLNQTAAIASTTLFSPENNNEFRVNVYMSATCGPDTGGELLQLDWNDGLSSNQFGNSVGCSANTSSYNQWSLVVHSVAGSSISFFTNAGNVTYNVYISVERL